MPAAPFPPTPAPPSLVLAVDGPAASGKGTIARALAQHFALPHLDTGRLYRALAVRALARGVALSDEAGLVQLALDPELADMAEAELRAPGAGEAASLVSVHPGVRAALVERQRAFARRPPGAVLDGRDIGTVILPDATVKLFVTADLAVRAARRQAEWREAGRLRPLAEVEADLRQRDSRDEERSTAPLARAPDALLLDTTLYDRDSAIARAIAMVEGARAFRALR